MFNTASSLARHVLVHPTNNFCRYGKGPVVILARHRLGKAGIPRLNGKASQSGRLSDGCRNLLSALLEHRDQLGQIVHEGEYDAPKQEQGFDRFFRGLLRVKAESSR